MRLHEREAYPGTEQEILAARPPCDLAMELVIDCWRSVEGDRHIGYGCVGPIPFVALDVWARRARVEGRMFDVVAEVIRRLDGERMERDAAERALKR